MVDQGSWRKRRAYQAVIQDPTDDIERKKVIISNAFYDILVWHIWAVISVTVSVLLVALNYVEYSIGGEIGGSPGATANILGTLQLAIKAHEITIVASLFMITRQWIQGSLIDMDKGIPLGLLGAEKELGQPSFLISKGYRVTVSYVVKQRRFDLCLLTIFLFAATVVSCLAGPASGVLMIPHRDWFFDSVLTSTVHTAYNYPYLLALAEFKYSDIIKVIMSHGSNDSLLDPFTPTSSSGLSYTFWHDLASSYTDGSLLQTESTYDSESGLMSNRVNISTTLGRSLENNHTGCTYAKTIMRSDVVERHRFLSEKGSGASIKHAEAMLRWSGRKYAVDGNAMTVEVNCHYTPKEQCPTAIVTAGKLNTDWCPQNLVLLAQDSREYRDNLRLTRVYMTEGPRTQRYPEFTDSYQVVLDRGNVSISHIPYLYSNQTYETTVIPSSRVIVCSITTTIQPVMVHSLTTWFTPVNVDYFSPGNKTILFHDRWLDRTNWLRLSDGPLPGWFADGYLTPPPRNMSVPTGNPYLGSFGVLLAYALEQILLVDPNYPKASNEASELETIVSGFFLSAYSNMSPSNSQYPYNAGQILPESMMPEPRLYNDIRNLTITVYNFGYGFGLSSRTGILGVTILIAHVVIVVLGSLWQVFWRRSVITAWDTIPDYVVLGLGSVIPPAVLDNTCAGIAATKTLQVIAKVGETTVEHLEIAVGEQKPGWNMTSVLGKLDVRYGSRGGERKEILE